MENIRNHRDIKFMGNKARSNYLLLQPNYHTKKKIKRIISYRNEKNINIHE